MEKRNTKEILLGMLRSGQALTTGQQFKLTMILAVPAILAQLSMCLMSYIDASMVGRLGSAQAAAVGLVSTTTWVLGSLCYASGSGFSVQIAHRCGAGDFEGARRIFRQGLFTVLGYSLMLTALGCGISGVLPHWLGGGDDITADASAYFLIYSAFLPVFQVAVYCEAALIASGNMKVPSITSMVMCVLDVAFNYLFIFVLGHGVKGAAIGTGLAELCAGAFLLVYASTRSHELKIADSFFQPVRRFIGFKTPAVERLSARQVARKIHDGTVLRQSLRISGPLWFQNLITRGAYVAATVLVAPLGTIAIAANSFAIIAEGFCYLPGYGMQDAATTLVGQSLGARRKDLARRFAYISILSGASMMLILAVFMWLFAPQIMGLLSQDPEVIALGARCLRIEAWAEFLFGVSIVAYGCCVGAGDSLVPSIISTVSMWVIRIGLAMVLIPRFGLEGYWYAMAFELSVKGIVFAFRVKGEKWMKTKLTAK